MTRFCLTDVQLGHLRAIRIPNTEHPWQVHRAKVFLVLVQMNPSIVFWIAFTPSLSPSSTSLDCRYESDAHPDPEWVVHRSPSDSNLGVMYLLGWTAEGAGDGGELLIGSSFRTSLRGRASLASNMTMNADAE